MHSSPRFRSADPNEDEYFGIDFVNDLPTDEVAFGAVSLTKLGDDPTRGHLVGPVIRRTRS
jgi:hypothetical protein